MENQPVIRQQFGWFHITNLGVDHASQSTRHRADRRARRIPALELWGVPRPRSCADVDADRRVLSSVFAAMASSLLLAAALVARLRPHSELALTEVFGVGSRRSVQRLIAKGKALLGSDVEFGDAADRAMSMLWQTPDSVRRAA